MDYILIGLAVFLGSVAASFVATKLGLSGQIGIINIRF